VTFTDPELAHAGKTEQELQESGVPYRIARMPFSELDRARTSGHTEGMVKLLASPNGKLLGAHILAEGAGELIAPLVVAMKASIGVEQLADTILPYPQWQKRCAGPPNAWLSARAKVTTWLMRRLPRATT